MPSNKVAIPPSTTSEAALDYVERGWPVVPGAIWHDGHFADPTDERQVVNPLLLGVDQATTDAEEARVMWSVPGLNRPNVFTVTGSGLGAFMVFDSLAEAIARHPAFVVRRTPVLVIQGMPSAYFLVRPPVPSVLLNGEARVVASGTPVTLPPSAFGETAVMWSVTPGEANGTLMAGGEPADIVENLEGA
ncbi:bifunctional DNA primase/polymerase [Saccharothrix sp. S26]|uniref:bifunctional DNA primase/polymerase n=1 Tax=Saccharothrix sp. S26 TaxID=2907215 RepID=UPI001F36FC9D|nr:bifunctional DNA primase/polymerase [Saccharothrix sp. S26]MCE6995251.1 bifunctional DNA primase/polymerase [Saccharothrix sp. S26]